MPTCEELIKLFMGGKVEVEFNTATNITLPADEEIESMEIKCSSGHVAVGGENYHDNSQIPGLIKGQTITIYQHTKVRLIKNCKTTA